MIADDSMDLPNGTDVRLVTTVVERSPVGMLLYGAEITGATILTAVPDSGVAR